MSELIVDPSSKVPGVFTMAKKRKIVPYLKFGPRIVFLISIVSALVIIMFIFKVEIIHSRGASSQAAATHLHLQPSNLQMIEALGHARIGQLRKQTTISGKPVLMTHPVTHTKQQSKIGTNLSLAKSRYSSAVANDSVDNFLVVNSNRKVLPKLACQMPDLEPFSESIMKHVIEPEPLVCDSISLTAIQNKQLVIRKIIEKEVKLDYCYVSTIDRISDFDSIVSLPTKVNITRNAAGIMTLQYEMLSDFTVVGCVDKISSADVGFFNDRSDFDSFYRENSRLFDLHAVVVPPSDVMQRFQTTKPPKDGLGLNIVMLALEATSRMNFIRQLPETYKLLGELGTIVLEGYNIVADATKGALIPMLTGKTELELPEVRKGQPGSDYVDVYPLIWKEFAKNGYATMFAEDTPSLSTFGLKLNGFNAQPTDHYMKNQWNAAAVRGHCLGSKPVHQVMLDYLSDYMTEYKDHPHFAFSFLVGLTHANINPLQLMDSDLYWFLHNANSQNYLNNTILVLFGDHGSRYSSIRLTLQGRLEERLPFMSITLPKWVHKRYPVLYENLVKNTNRLATPFDIYETLQSVLHYNVKPANVNQRGIGLFNEIPPERTCSDADVAPHWCACLTWVPADPKMANRVAAALIRRINKETEVVRNRCHELKLKVIVGAQMVLPNKQVLLFKNTDDDHRKASFNNESMVDVAELPTLYQVTVETTPGGAQFEGTVRVLPQSKNNIFMYKDAGEVSRINRYGNQADCLLTVRPHLMKFCYCKE